MLRSIAPVAYALALACAKSFGAAVVIPAALASAPGDVNIGIGPAATLQFLFNTSTLGALPAGAQISGMQVRMQNGGLPNAAFTVPNFDVRLGTSANSTLSNTFASNYGADTTLTRSGPLTIPAGDLPYGNGPNAFGSVIPFTTPYAYGGGDLLVSISMTQANRTLFFDATRQTPGLQYRYDAAYNSATATFAQDNTAMVMQLVYTPEPAALSILALAGLLGRRNR
ncbi:MAG: hypothetical protein JWM57_3086 [Phycisphaerales bacterium]|nr:hypothetical protein [Phycisphaerales bacterium]